MTNSVDQLIAAAIRATAGLPALAERHAQLEALGRAGADALTVGVIGITSSGKSTFLNGLMGERLLPEESRATTNLLVKCRSGATRQAVLHFRDGRRTMLEGAQLTPDALGHFCSERLNPGNEARLAFIEWTSPRSVLPPGLVLVDTPGFDAYGHREHEQIALREFLPLADIVIYMTSIRNPFKAADLRAVGAILENDQRVLFVLSQADLEVDSYQGGRLWKSREDKLARHVERLQKDVREYTTLQTYGIVLVSSKKAKHAAGERTTEAWRESNFEQVLAHLMGFSDQLAVLLSETRARKLIAQVERAARECEHILSAGDGALSVDAGSASRRRQQALERARQAVVEQRAAVVKEWRSAVDDQRLSRRVGESLPGSGDVDAYLDAHERLTTELESLPAQMTAKMDQAVATARKALKDVGLFPARSESVRAMLDRRSPPDPHAHVRQGVEEVEVRGWFDSWAFWPKSEMRPYRRIDQAAATKELRAHAMATGRSLSGHLSWWETHYADAYMSPIAAELESERRALAQVEEARRAGQRERELVVKARDALRQLEQASRDALAALANEARRTHAAAPTTAARRARARADATTLLPLRGLLATFSELAIQSEFQRVMASVSSSEQRRILLLGPRRMPPLELLAALSHDLGLAAEWARRPEMSWFGTADALAHPGAGQSVLRPPAGSVLEHASVLVAPPHLGNSAAKVDWEALVASADVILVDVDAARIASGLSELASAPWSGALVGARERVVLCSGAGALFNDRLAHLITDVRATASLGPLGDRPWFVHEDYDARYTAFLRLFSHVDAHAGSPQELVRRWREEGLSLSPPFTQVALLQESVAAGLGQPRIVA